MEVIGVGFGRTGTASLREALNILGMGPTYHTKEILKDPARLADWQAAVDGADVDWDQVFAGYRSTVDWPGAAFWRELVERYPEAKVILTVRDPVQWHRSCMRTIFMAYRQDLFSRLLVPAMQLPLRALDRRFGAFNEIFDGVFRRHFGDGPIQDEKYAVEVFDKHVRDVQECVPAERLLVYRVSEGWPTLCKFLGVGVPIVAFPHDNDQDAFQRDSRLFVTRGLARMVTGPVRRAVGRFRRAQDAPEAAGQNR
ncbi:sulfotransferase family protein [Micromonospora sp. BRA006-A]|uniref:sulfotransferase family protein n=1 Tax=Micromonospora sp. BRA006-A TaxID=2962860 RepID=UPI00296F8EDD|nr:sulfotransferase [Micromonospora sp. BRA006-A]MDW3847619.1 sulfotransferase family protein [Micromonospora sp. BRA006-A]